MLVEIVSENCDVPPGKQSASGHYLLILWIISLHGCICYKEKVHPQDAKDACRGLTNHTGKTWKEYIRYKKQGGFARLIRDSHALEAWYPLSLKRDNLKLVLPFFVSYYLFSYSLTRALVHPLLQVKQVFSACQAVFLFK